MDDIWLRFFENLSDRVSGPMKFRILMQPIVAMTFAIIAGLRDARIGRPPYFWALLTHPGQRTEMLKNGWKDVGNVFVIALLLDVVYQLVVARFIYPGESLVVAIVLALAPYLLVRGLVTRIARKRTLRTP